MRTGDKRQPIRPSRPTPRERSANCDQRRGDALQRAVWKRGTSTRRSTPTGTPATAPFASAQTVRMTRYTWNPMNPTQHGDGIGLIALPATASRARTDPFIGEYFGLAISNANI